MALGLTALQKMQPIKSSHRLPEQWGSSSCARASFCPAVTQGVELKV